MKVTRNRGVALIVALGVLVVLALLGTVFATLTQVERSVARNYIDKVRARLLAVSGIEDTLSRLQKAENLDIWRTDRIPPWIYYGGDLNANGVVDAGNPADIDNNADGIPDTNDLSVTEAIRPSFMLDADSNGIPDLVDVDLGTQTVKLGLTGRTQSSTYGPNSDFYSVRVIDLGSKINVNMIHPNLATILNNLAQAVGGGVPTDLGTKVVSNRPAVRGYADTNELRAALAGAGVAADLFDQKIKPFVTTYGWMDTKAVKPVPLSRRVRAGLQMGLGGRPNSDLFAMWEMRPRDLFDSTPPAQGTGSSAPFGVEPRCPININHAPIEVLVAVIAGLKGMFVFEDSYATYPYDWHGLIVKYDGSLGDLRRQVQNINGRVGTIFETPPIPLGIKPTGGTTTNANGTGAWGIAKAIVDYRNKTFQSPTGFIVTGSGANQNRNFFRSFQQFYEFVDGLDPKLFEPIDGYGLPITVPGHGQKRNYPAGAADPLPLNYLPMVKDVLKANFNPNCHLNELNPEESLALWVDKTDLTYHTTEFTFIPMGYFEIQSAGWVLDDQRRVAAQEVITSEVKVYECWRDTNQWDFMKEWADNGQGIGNYFSSNASADTVEQANGGNVALRSYPELQDVNYVKSTAAGKHSSFDGYISLNTIRPPANGAQFGMMLHYGDGFNPDAGSGNFEPEKNRAGQYRGPYRDRLVGGGSPGSLTNEGLLCEREASPGYDNANFDQHRGAVSMWVKPNFRPENSGRNRVWLSSNYHEMAGEPSWMGTDPAAEGAGCPFWSAVSGIFCIANHRNESLVPQPHDGYDRHSEDEQPVYQSGSPGYNWREHPIAAGFGGRYGGPVNPDGQEYEGGCSTPCTNHLGHNHTSFNGWGNDLIAHRWMHVAWAWDDRCGNSWIDPTVTTAPASISNLFVNGKPSITPDFRLAHWTCDNDPDVPNDQAQPRCNTRWGPDVQFANHPYKPGNGVWGALPPLRIGAEADPPMPNGVRASWLYCQYTADATIDEVYVWKSGGNGNLNLHSRINLAFLAGRFYRENDATFTSPKVDLGTQTTRLLAPKGSASAPAGAGGTTVVASGGTSSLPIPQTRLGLFAYTGMWPNQAIPDPAKMGSNNGANASALPVFSLAIVDPAGGTEWMPLQGTAATHPARLGGCAITNNTNPLDPAALPVLAPNRVFRYRVRIAPNLAGALNMPLMFSPVLDDITITYYDQPPQFLGWVVGGD